MHWAGLACWPLLVAHSSLAHPQLGIVAARLGILAFSHDRCCLPQRSAHLCSGSSDATVVAVGCV